MNVSVQKKQRPQPVEFIENDALDYRFEVIDGTLIIRAIQKKNSGIPINPYAAFAPGEWITVRYFDPV